MKENLEKLFKNRKTENLVVFLIILIVTLIVLNQILKEDTNSNETNTVNTAVLASSQNVQSQTNIEKRLEDILKKMNGIGNVSVLITYSESGASKLPMYNENYSSSSTEENNKTISTETREREVIMGADQNPVIQTIENPRIEGAIITAQGAANAVVKSNIIAAVEAATGLATHKIQVFEMKE